MTFLLALVLVGWDGADYRVVSEMRAAGELSNLARLHWGELEITGVTQTCPSWEEQLSGLPWYVIGTIDNGHCVTVPAGRTIFEYLATFAKTSAYITGKPGNLSVRPGGPFANVPSAASLVVADDTLTIEAMGDLCLDAASKYDFVFCHSKMPDRAGHRFGGGSEEYRRKLRCLDVQLGRYLDAGLTVLLTSDHGFEQLPFPEGYEDPVYPVRHTEWGKYPGFAHLRQPRAIIGSTVAIDLTRPTQRDVFRTLVAMLRLPPAPWALEGRSLLR